MQSTGAARGSVNEHERRMRFLRRNILGIADRAIRAVEDSTEELRFEVSLRTAKAYWEEFQQEWKLLDAAHSSASQGDAFPSDDWLHQYDQIQEEITEAETCLLVIQRRAQAEVARPSNPEVSRMMTTLGGSARRHLPKISIPEFSGDLWKWTHFKDTFTSLVHQEECLTDIEKLHYLLSATKGEAASLLASFPIEQASYSLAWNKLVENYDNPRILANAFIERILDCDLRNVRDERCRYDRFLAEVGDSIDAFKKLNLEDPLEVILSTLALRSLDMTTRKKFEISWSSLSSHPLTGDVIHFVRQRMNALKLTAGANTSKVIASRGNQRAQVTGRTNTMTLHAATTSSIAPRNEPHISTSSAGIRKVRSNRRSPPITSAICPYCKDQHALTRCARFAELPSAQRAEFAQSWKGCQNCLWPGHDTSCCPSKGRCRYCGKEHHSLIHAAKYDQAPRSAQASYSAEDTLGEAERTTFTGVGRSVQVKAPNYMVVLGTAKACIRDIEGRPHGVRCILDSGSQKTFITASLARKLGRTTASFSGTITGIGGGTVIDCLGSTECVLTPLRSQKEFVTDGVIVPKITSNTPSIPMDGALLQHFSHHNLADDLFYQPDSIDILIGCDLYPQVITGAPRYSGFDGLFFLPSVFGLVIIGKVTCPQTASAETLTFLSTSSVSEVESLLQRFWDVEEPSRVIPADPHVLFAEEHFKRTHERTIRGRYVVQLPSLAAPSSCGTNREVATRRFLNLERKFGRDPLLKESYTTFMREYAEMGHMSLASAQSNYIIPHHPIWQRSAKGSKLRVVFDASCKSKASSLNDILMCGPKLQADLPNILIRFRLYRIPLCADIVKMYRQILVHPEQRHLQHIFWREQPTETLQEFELNTVTYGVKPSAFLAMRVVQQLASDEGAAYPLAAERIRTSMYVDDIVTGADTIDEAIALREELCGLLSKGGFPLGKWASTVPEVLPPEDRKSWRTVEIKDETGTLKILGLVWDPSSDCLSFTASDPPVHSATKRTVLSAIARIFDPLGLLAPVIMTAKVLLQEVWKAKLEWDDPLPPELLQVWSTLAGGWQSLTTISIPRYIGQAECSYRVVGFCDASSKGYAAAIYLMTETNVGKIQSHLIKAKTKVAPVKFLSIPRMELCGAVLLARLLSSIDIPEVDASTTVCFTDSTVTLDWIRTPTYSLKVFEANRVATVLEHTQMQMWRHVSSEENPADLASRGCRPADLLDQRLWWHGPDWLQCRIENWPTYNDVAFTAPENSRVLSACMQPGHALGTETSSVDEWMQRFSSLDRLVRVTAYLLRFLKGTRKEFVPSSRQIASEEFQEALFRCVRIAQSAHLPRALFQRGVALPKTFGRLLPFLDTLGIIRVGGRLQNAPLSLGGRHPALVPKTSHLAKILVNNIHISHYHSGPSLTLALIRGRFWIPGGIRFVRSQLSKCTSCRVRMASPLSPQMAPLPKDRFSQLRPFANSGVDFAGPFQIKESTRRKAALGKSYLCLFVCLATKAVHLEAVSALTTAAFLAALNRFTSRRGLPNIIWSDNGTNFVGASRYLKELYRFLAHHEHELVRALAPNGVQWKFIPPATPNFGGIWEAGVKSVKKLLAGSLGKQPFTFEELSTIFCRIEGMLNSRPLCALTDDVEACHFLTPGHFLIGEPLSFIPDAQEVVSIRTPSARWSTINDRVALVWDRWRQEYLHSLQQRAKWIKEIPSVKVGDLVVLVEKRLAVGQWPVARVVELHPGPDGVTRVLTVKTPSGSNLVRAVRSVAPLLCDETKDSK